MSARFEVIGETSLLLISARSSVGRISWTTNAISGWLDATVDPDGSVSLENTPTAEIAVAIASLTSGNVAYDAELSRRIDSRAYPFANLRLERTAPAGEDARFVVAGSLDFHGVTRGVDGAVALDVATPDRLVVSGEQTFDIRDFGIATPRVLRMRIYPDVRLQLLLEARRVEGDS